MFARATPEARQAKQERVKRVAMAWRKNNRAQVAAYNETRRLDLRLRKTPTEKKGAA